MYAKFKLPYAGAKIIYDPSDKCTYCAFRSYNRRWVYFDVYTKMDDHWVDRNGEVWVEDRDGYVVKDTLERRLQDEHYQ